MTDQWLRRISGSSGCRRWNDGTGAKRQLALSRSSFIAVVAELPKLLLTGDRVRVPIRSCD